MPTCPPGCPGHKPLSTAATGRGAVLPLPPFPTHSRVSPGPGLRFGRRGGAPKVPAGHSDSVPTRLPRGNR